MGQGTWAALGLLSPSRFEGPVRAGALSTGQASTKWGIADLRQDRATPAKPRYGAHSGRQGGAHRHPAS